MSPAGIFESHDLMTYISWSANFRLRPYIVLGNLLSSVDGIKFIVY